MAHVAVERRSMSFDQWVKCNFDKYEDLVVEKTVSSGNWKVREGEYHPDGYKWYNDFREIHNNDRWGGPDVTALFEGWVEVPKEWEGEDVYFQMLTSTEVIVSSKGKMLEGLDPNRRRFILFPKAQPGQYLPIQMEAYTRSKPDDDRNPRAAAMRGCVQLFNAPVLVVLDPLIQSLVWDLNVLYMTAFGSSINEDVQSFLKKKIHEMLPLMPPLNGEDFLWRKAAPKLKGFLKKEIFNANLPFPKEGHLACVSHSHLDIAYFWRVKQTIQKNARTVLIQLNLMDRYPEFSYAHSQAWTYEMLEKYYPELFERLKQRVKEGRWEIVGAMYVEPDCNLVSAESLFRQIMYGKQYFMQKFGVDVKNCWLPDVFGNSAILPQILKKTGTPYFVSNKMSTWNDTNRFPHNHFLWRGVDGSDVFACVPPVHFITWMDPNQAVKHWEALQDKDVVHESLQMYGYGDGGSGATDEMIEYFHRQQKLPGIPEQRLTTAGEFLKTNFDGHQDLPVWQGDLYLEMHRGTFTNKAQLKKLNRYGENRLKESEALCTMAFLSGFSYPVEELKACWKILLLNQFHDILPGTHVWPVFKDCLESYKELFQRLDKLNIAALEFLSVKDKDVAFIFNRDGRLRRGLAYCGDVNVPKGYLSQKIESPNGNINKIIRFGEIDPFQLKELPPLVKETDGNLQKKLQVSTESLESPFFAVRFNKKGEIISIYDKTYNRQINRNKEVLNKWELFEDTPGRYNAWDIVDRFEDRSLDCGDWEHSRIVENGPLTAGIRWERSFGKSKAVQIVRVFAFENRIEFDVHIDWQEREKLLKTAFPLNIHSPHFSCDNSAGVTYYENHRNTSWQEARFEVPCHRWVDLSEGLYGVSLINDSKYGVDVKAGQLRLSLLRASVRPDPYSDQGEHDFRYAITSHGGQWQNSHLLDNAQEINEPLHLYSGKLRDSKSFHSVIKLEPSLQLQGQSLKVAEDGSGDIIFRFIEYSGTACTANIYVCFPLKTAFVADGLERSQEELLIDNQCVELPVKAFEIITLRFSRKDEV